MKLVIVWNIFSTLASCRSPNNSTIFNWSKPVFWRSSSLDNCNISIAKHEVFQKVKRKFTEFKRTTILCLDKIIIFLPRTNVNGCKHTWESCVQVMKLPSKSVLEYSFLLFICLLLHFVSSFPFLIHKQLFRKIEVSPVVAWNIANHSQSSKQWVHSCQMCAIGAYFRVIFKQNLDFSVPNYIHLEWLVSFFIFLS